MALGSGTKYLDFCWKWDKDEYEKLAEKQLTEEREKKDGKAAEPVKRELRLQSGPRIQAGENHIHHQNYPSVRDGRVLL